ncbi:MAG: insulinase family protein [Paludibacteraceae bacterium]|nr:insulinase family protein [Paludibacteraceae bacterium]
MSPTFYDILPNGIQIVHRYNPSSVAYIGILVGAGTRHEEENENGMAHYIEHTLFKGCRIGDRTLSARQIIERVEGVGGEINAYTTKEETVFYAATPQPYIKRTLELIANLVFQPTFPKEETDKELRVIFDEIESYNDSPSELIYDDFESLLFAGHPLSQPILGTRKTLRRINRSSRYPLKWMHRHYNTERIVIFSQGNIPFPRLKQTIEKVLSVIPLKHFTSSFTPTTPPQPTVKPSTINFRKHTHQTHIMLGAQAYPLGDKRQLTTYLLNHILGGGNLSSRLNMSLREKRGLVYTVESQFTPLSDCGYWSVYFATENQHKDECLTLCRLEMKRLRDKSLSSLQLKRILQQLRGQMAIAAENQENNVLTMGKQMLYFHTAPTWEETFAQLEQITPQEIQDVANELFDESRLCMLSYC